MAAGPRAPELRALAPAKVNLALHVTGRRADGYHLLDSLVVFADLGDMLTLRDGPGTEPGISLSLTGPQAPGVPPGPENLILRAARAMGVEGGHERLAFTLEKRLPVASGLGGGSSDAAAALRCIAARTGAALPDGPALLRLGADLPVCLAATPSRMRGIGERIDPLPPLPPLWMVLVNPGVPLSTAAVFAALARRDNPGLPALPARWPDTRSFCTWLRGTRNDLEPAACAIAPQVLAAIDALHRTRGCLLARMSGSGASVFGLFADAGQAERAAARLRARAPAWWVAPAGLLPPGDAAPGAPEL